MIGALVLSSILLIFVNQILFAVEALECKVIDFIYNLFEIFAGIQYMQYDGEPTLFVDVFFKNPVITTVYTGMALIGFAMSFGFAIVAVVRKLFDSTGEKVKATYGMIITNLFKSTILIFLMTTIVSATILASSTLMRSIDSLFDNAEELTDPSTITFSDEDRAVMMRVVSKIGNYTLNESSNNRYNINSCFNDIRADLQTLENERVFNYTYEGAENTWQYALLQIYLASDIDKSVPLDQYNQQLTEAIMDCGYQIQYEGTFAPLDSYTRLNTTDKSSGSLGRTIMLAGSMTSAINSKYNKDGHLTDALRRPFYVGDKNCYDWDEMTNVFNITLFGWDHLVILVVGWFVMWELAKIMFNAIARVFNIILLYITAPGFLAVMPLDDGGKFKQWTLAFIIQSCSLLGSFIAVRLMVMFIPIVMARNFVVVPDSTFGNYVAKLLVLCGIVFTCGKASGMISGILADQAGYQSIMAGDVGSGLAEKGRSFAGSALKAGAKAGFAVGAGAINLAADQTKYGRKANEKFENFQQSIKDKGGFTKAARSGFSTNQQDQQQKEEESKKQNDIKSRNQDDFQNKILEKLDSLGGGGGDKAKMPPK